MIQDITIRIPSRIAIRLASSSIEDTINQISELLYNCDCQDGVKLISVYTKLDDIRIALLAVHEACEKTCNHSSSQSTISDDSRLSLEKDTGGIITI